MTRRRFPNGTFAPYRNADLMGHPYAFRPEGMRNVWSSHVARTTIERQRHEMILAGTTLAHKHGHVTPGWYRDQKPDQMGRASYVTTCQRCGQLGAFDQTDNIATLYGRVFFLYCTGRMLSV